MSASKDGSKMASFDSKENDSIIQEGLISQIRIAVNESQIKLWTPPYFDNAAPNDDKLRELAATLATRLEMDDLVVFNGLKQLQQNALEKLQARTALAASNQMLVKVKLSKSGNASENLAFSLQVDVNCTGQQLAEKIAERCQSGSDGLSFKLIAGGKTLSDAATLSEQGLKPGCTVMALKIDRNDDAIAVVSEQRRILETTITDATILGAGFGGESLQITDQNGKELDLPVDEKNALILAMSLHEKGRAAVRRSNFDLALVLLLESVQEYKRCRLEILKTVDNYAILNLDVAWCYLRLGNVSELPNAVQCLEECESNFVQSYGANLERLQALKGSTGEESVLLVRMHLLQSIVNYHTGRLAKAKSLLRSVDEELANLLVSEESLEEVMAAGFSKTEARLALRASGKDVASAIKYAQQTKERREAVVEEERERKRKRRKLGKTAEGNWVNLGYLDTMTKMGYEELLAVSALRQTDNDINAAIEIIENRPECLFDANDDHQNNITDEMVESLRKMGFDMEEVKKAVVKFKGDAGMAIEALTSGANVEDETTSDANDANDGNRGEGEENRRQEAYDRLEQDLDDHDGYLDPTLDDEKAYLERYKKIMGL